MLTIDDIRNSIVHLREMDDDKVLTAIEDIFYDIIYADAPLYIAFIKTIPYMAPTTQDRQNFYLRLFSHKEIADAHKTNHPDLDIRELSVLETLQLAKTCFLCGGHGFILNEGDKWIGITLATYLRLFLTRVVNDQGSVQQGCVDLVWFINTLRRNSEYRYTALIRDGEWEGPNDSCLIQVDGPDAEQQDSSCQMQPITAQSLFHVPKDKVHIAMRGKELETSRQMILGVLSYCGYISDPDFVPPSGFFNEPASMDQRPWEDWHSQDLSLSFPPIEPVPVADSDSSEEVQDDGAETAPEAHPNIKERLAPVIASGVALLAGFKEKLSRFGKKNELTGDDNGEEQSESAETLVATVPSTSGTAETVLPQEPVATVDDVPSRPSPKRRGLKRGPVILSLAVVVVIFSVVGIIVTQQHHYQETVNQFCAYVDGREYGNAYSLYAKERISTDADAYLVEHLDTLVLGYANNALSAEELSAAMGALGNFPSMQQNIEVARLTASKLETSKNAYVHGKEAEDVFAKLDFWRQVLELDSVNYAAMQQNIKDNRPDYEESLNTDIEYYSTRIRSFAKARYEVLAFWYPDSTYLDTWAGKYESDDSAPLNLYPVAVNDVNIRQNPNGYWYLYIDWKNISVKTIKTICFSTVALDEAGDIVTCTDTQGSWTIFDARDANTYDPGAKSSGEDYFWTGAFYGSQVAEVKLTAVNVKYSDGSTASYTSDVDLSYILKD